MRIRTKLTLTIAAASIVPILAATLVGRELVQHRSRQEFAKLLGDGRVEVRTRYRAMQEEVTEAVERLADPEDRFIGRILLDLAAGDSDNDRVRSLVELAPRVMHDRGLDVLTVLDPHGRILASGHFPGRLGDIDPDRVQRGGTAAQRPDLVHERVLEQGKPVTHLTVQVRRRAKSELGQRVIVIGGRVLGPGFVRRLRLRGGTEVMIRDAQGRRLAGPEDWARYQGYPSEVVPLVGADGEETARITLAVPDDGLRQTLHAINVTAASLVGSGLVLSLVLGMFAARRITRPIQDLVSGAEAVAQGELDTRLQVRTRDEVGELVKAFNRMTSDLAEAREKLVAAERVAAWREIARRIAHEIKNPLFPIQTSIETLRKVHQKQHPDFEEIFDESTTTILEEVERLKTIASEFSQFARMPKPRLEPCSIKEVLSAVTVLYGSDRVPVRCELPDVLPAVQGDREQLTQVFSNLVKNAIEAQASVESPEVVISAAEQAGAIEISVSDNGPGFSAEVEAKIFTPYFTTKGAAGGSGLGLAIVHRIVMDHGGRIEARSGGEGGGGGGGERAGATFLVRLPSVD